MQFTFLNKVINCGPLTDPENGRVGTSNGTSFGSTATYSCDTGSRTCGADGNWTSVEPSCPIQSVLNSSLKDSNCSCPTSWDFGSVIAGIWFFITMVLLGLCVTYIVHLKIQLKKLYKE